MAVNQFELEAITLISTVSTLSDIEKQILTALRTAAENGGYWDTLSRLAAKIDDLDTHIANIVAKVIMVGLKEKLEGLRK